MNFMRLFHNLERVEQFKTRHQKHYTNDEDELERYDFFKKLKARFTKHLEPDADTPNSTMSVS